MTHHLISQLAVLGFTKEAAATALSLITVAHARLQMGLRQCNKREQHIREEIEEAYLAVDQASRVLGTLSAFTHQEYKQVSENLKAGGIRHLTSG